MSKNSYSLSEAGGRWVCEGTLESGRAIRFDVGEGTLTREAADAVAALKWGQRLQQSAASKSRWAKHYGAAGGASSTPATPSPAAAERNAKIRAKLVGVGDAKPIDEDATVHPSLDDAKAADGQADDDDDDDDVDEAGEDDDEAAEVLADVIGTGIYNGLIVGGTTKLLKRAKPPKRPGDPHELFVRYGQEGLCYRVRKLIGKDAKLGPNGKLAIGLAGTIVMMLWNAEDLEPEAGAAAAAPPPAPAPPRAREAAAAAGAQTAENQKPRTELRLVRPPAAPTPPAPPPGSSKPPPAPPPDDGNPIGTFR